MLFFASKLAESPQETPQFMPNSTVSELKIELFVSEPVIF